MNDEIAGDVEGPYNKKRDPLKQFFNGTLTAYDTEQDPTPITWIAFPNQVRILKGFLSPSHEYVFNNIQVTVNFGSNNDLRWKIADASRMFQDEYLEWSVKRDVNGDITSAVFTCEGPEVSLFTCSRFDVDLQSLSTGNFMQVFNRLMQSKLWSKSMGLTLSQKKRQISF
jgi:hypothetical protein